MTVTVANNLGIKMKHIILLLSLLIANTSIARQIFVKNDTVSSVTWVGKTIVAAAYYEIQPYEEIRWANDSTFLTAIGASDAVMAKSSDGTEDITDVSDGINFLKDVNTTPVSDYSELKYVQVPANSTDSTGGVIIPNGQKVSVYKIRLNGSDSDSYAKLVWDHGGGAEKVFISTKGDVDTTNDLNDTLFHITGDGVKSLKIILENNTGSQSPDIGGTWSAQKI